METSNLCEFNTKNALLCEISQHNKRNNMSFFDKDDSSLHVHNLTMPTTEASSILSKWLIEAIEKAQTNQSALARSVGLTSQKVNRVVKGEREMTAEELIRFSAKLNAPIPSLPGSQIDDALQPPLMAAISGSVKGTADEATFQRAYNRSFATALEIENSEYDGEMPLELFINFVRLGIKAQLKDT